MTVTYFHGTNSGSSVLNALTGNGMIKPGFCLTTDLNTAKNYGSTIIKVELEKDFTKAHVGFINKDGNYNSSVGNKLETVLKDPASINELYFNILDAEVLH